MKLTKAQIEHAAMRLNQVAAKRIAAASHSIGEKPSLPQLTFTEKCDLIRQGKAKLKPQQGLNRCTDLEDAYTYPSHERLVEGVKKHIAVWETAHKKISDRVNAERDRVLDRIMLGDAADALAAIDAFAAGK